MPEITENISSKNNSKKTVIIALIAFIVILLIGFTIFLLTRDLSINTTKNNTKENNLSKETENSKPNVSQNNNTPVKIEWSFNGTKWTHNSTVPECEEPITFKAPVDLSLASAILYPGQIRGGNYKAHGGFILDINTNEANVSLPIDAIIYQGSRYIENGEVQIMIDFINNCGLMIRFDHIQEVAPDFIEYIEMLPEAKPDESRTTPFNNQKLIKAGTIIATKIGHKNPFNASFDFGFYDLRNQNQISLINSEYANKYKSFPSQIFYGVCWLDYLVTEDKSVAYSLPGPGTEGKQSDYCLTTTL